MNDCSNLISENKNNIYTVMIILKRTILMEQFINLKKISDYVICTEGAASKLYRLKDVEKYNTFCVHQEVN